MMRTHLRICHCTYKEQHTNISLVTHSLILCCLWASLEPGIITALVTLSLPASDGAAQAQRRAAGPSP